MSGSSSYDYDAAGTKHQYITDTLTVKYANDFQYNASNNFSRLALTEGQAIFRNDTLRFDYYLKDHLGNVRIVFDEKGKILQQTDYYLFGLEISRDTPASTQAARNGANRYNFLGRETQVSTGYIDLQARFYDPVVGRFFRIDPMLEYAYDWTPYRYGFDNPIRYSDEDGLFETEEEARKYAKDNGIRTGWFSDNKIRQQADGSYAINNKSAGTSIFNDKNQGVTTAALATGTRESSGSTSDASTMALPISLSLPSLAGIGEKVAEISLNGLKTAATIPLMTLAFVLTPTPAGQGSTVNQYVLHSHQEARNWREDKLLSPGEINKLKKKGWDHSDKKGRGGQRDLYKDKDGNVYEKPKGGNGPGEPIDYNLKDL